MARRRTKLFLINAALIAGLAILLVVNFLGRVYRHAPPAMTEWKEIFTRERMMAELPEFWPIIILLFLAAIFITRE